MTPVRTVVLLLAAASIPAACDRGPPPEPAALAAAEAMLAEGRFGEALRGLRALPPAELTGPGARLRAAKAAVQGGDHALALRVLEAGEGAGERPSAEARLLRAEALLRTGDLAGARKALADIERGGVRTERWRFLYALTCLAGGQRESGEKELEALVKEGSRDPDVHLRWAEAGLPLPGVAQRRLAEALVQASDRGPVLAALGALLLRQAGDPVLARRYLEEAVGRRPFDRDARLDLARARFRQGSPADIGWAGEEAARLLVQEPGDAEARLLLAESFAEKGRLDLEPGAPSPPPAVVRSWDRAAKEYEALLGGGVDGPATAIRALQGLARIHVEEIPLDPVGRARGPGTHHARAMELLDRADSLNPGGTLPGGPHGTRLVVETWYLRGRAARKAHTGTSDHTDALRWFQKAFEADPRHLEASWDLGLLCHDFFPDSKEYRELAASAFRAHVFSRAEEGLPPLDPGRRAIVEECLKRAGRTLEPR